MLTRLTIKDFVIIDEVILNFDKGFNVLTGETGAGKSILIDAVGLLLGDRSDSTQVKQGADYAKITAEFDIAQLPHVKHWLDREQLPANDHLILARHLDPRGRSRHFINQKTVTLAQLKTVGEWLIDIHGQQSHQSLIHPQTQRQLLDAYAGATSLAHEVTEAWRAWQKAIEIKQAAQHQRQSAQASSDRLRFQISEVSQLAMRAHEWQTLNITHQQLAHANTLVTEVQQALLVLSDEEHAQLNRLTQAQQALHKAATIDKELLATEALLDSACVELREVVHQLRQYMGKVKEDPEQLARIESRMDRILTLARKYHVEPEVLSDQLALWQAELDQLNEGLDSAALEEAEAAYRDTFYRLAAQLTQKRVMAAQDLSQSIVGHMQSLAMPSACFEIRLTSLDEASAQGMEGVEYAVSTNKGVDLQALSKVASGGELSRLSLAMRVALSEVSHIPTLIFDEVDSGVGGSVAETIGQLLKGIGQHSQIFAITHLPQVAVQADNHWQVNKIAETSHVVVQVNYLAPEARIEEIARMLGGLHLTATTRQHAQELLASAQLHYLK